jgi:hypothetical protein
MLSDMLEALDLRPGSISLCSLLYIWQDKFLLLFSFFFPTYIGLRKNSWPTDQWVVCKIHGQLQVGNCEAGKNQPNNQPPGSFDNQCAFANF